MGMQNVEYFYPLSPMQQGLLFHTLSAPDTGVYFNQLVCTFSGELNIPVFEKVWQQVIQRHSILRTCFRWEGLKEPVQVVLCQVQLPLKYENWQGLSSSDQQQKLAAFLASNRSLGFDLTQAPLMRLALIQITENTYQFVWNNHHLITDGWSTSLLLQEVFKLYNAFCQGEELRLESPRPYRDYIKWLHQQDLHKAETFWRKTLSGFSAPTNLPIDKTISSNHRQIKNHATQEIKFSASQTAAMRSLVRQHKLTLNNLIQGAWAWLLSYYSGETDVVFGVTVSGRPVTLDGAESMLGLFINTLPLRINVSSDTDILPFLKQIQAKQAEISQYEYSPLVQVQGWSEVPRGMSLFDSILVFENYPVDTSKRQLNNLEILNVFTDQRTNYPLTVTVLPSQELSLEIAYDSDRFDDDVITRMLGHLSNLLAGIVANPQQRLSDLPLLTAAEKHTLLVEWNNTQTDYSQDLCIHQLFEAQVEKTPDAVAVVFENQQLTYQELNQRANQLAHYLRKQGVGPEVLVGICVERSLEMIIGLLAILKAGGAYLPLDPTYPQARLAFMLQDAQVRILLTQVRLLEVLASPPAKVICLDQDWEVISRENRANLKNQVSHTNNAYLLYTSGSTGNPKAVLIEHRNTITLLNWAREVFSNQDLTGVLASTSICFDLSVFELFLPISWGGKVILIENILQMPSSVTAQEVTLINTVPSAISELLRINGIPASVKTINLAGESLPPKVVQQLYENTSVQNVFNLYGPSEDTTYSTFSLVKPEDDVVTIGRPIANTQIYILDSHLQPVPVGIPGEIYIGGAGLARGYWNRPELTAEKFIPHHFADQPNQRLYKTGDLARYLPNGDIEFLGRIDHQVKIRGFRIEIGEIEEVINQHPEIREVVVIVREDRQDDKRLVAYVVAHSTDISVLEIRKFLKAKLPDYMIPTAFVILESLPLTPNGKIDRRALPAPDISIGLQASFVPPRTPTEQIIADIWADVLGQEKIGIDDNFFELGGHSLLATQVISRLRQAFKIDLPLRSLFENPTIINLVQRIEGILSVQQMQTIPTQMAEDIEEIEL